MKKTKKSKCKHPPERLYSWTAEAHILCIGCCDCGQAWIKQLKSKPKITIPIKFKIKKMGVSNANQGSKGI